MYRRFVPFVLLVVGCCFSICAALAESPPAKQQAPELRLHVAGRQNVGEARGFSLAVEVSNPGTQMLRYVGYRPDSFDPPIPKGQMQPIYRIELKQAGKWQQHPIGWCGTGMDDLEFVPKASATFGVWVPAGPWEAVRIGSAWRAAGGRKEAAAGDCLEPRVHTAGDPRGLPPCPPSPPSPSSTTRSGPPSSTRSSMRTATRSSRCFRTLFIVVDRRTPTRLSSSKKPNHRFADRGGFPGTPGAGCPRARAGGCAGEPARKGRRGQWPEPLVVAYPIRHADGDAAAGVLRSLFLVVNHQVAYARFGYDARTRSLIAIASREHQKQIAKVVELLDVQPAPPRTGLKRATASKRSASTRSGTPAASNSSQSSGRNLSSSITRRPNTVRLRRRGRAGSS